MEFVLVAAIARGFHPWRRVVFQEPNRDNLQCRRSGSCLQALRFLGGERFKTRCARRRPATFLMVQMTSAVCLQKLADPPAFIEKVHWPALLIRKLQFKVDAEHVVERGQHVLRRVRDACGCFGARAGVAIAWPIFRPPPIMRAKPASDQ